MPAITAMRLKMKSATNDGSSDSAAAAKAASTADKTSQVPMTAP
jgi:hypothetical protein